ncbi:unnamed protein product [Cylicostephanus goldi]|uniref:RING-type domain-containing protein n=1 Tax=Cylicostephanus goldi TaxID=71465 RepID=A0A3P7QIQ5_CYLGO|nr:unnamed protein product [Cylicostephanus goldi]
MSFDILFTEGLPSDCACPVCDQALRAPVITACGHNFCKCCISTENGPVPCPVCQSEIAIGSLKADKSKHRQVRALIVQCPYFHYGCEWTGPLKELKAKACRMLRLPRSPMYQWLRQDSVGMPNGTTLGKMSSTRKMPVLQCDSEKLQHGKALEGGYLKAEDKAKRNLLENGILT